MWSPDSWREKSALQQPDYADPAELERVLADLHALPPLVTSWEILRLHDQLAEAAAGRQFVLQAGDRAERFVDCTPARITNTIKVLLQMFALPRPRCAPPRHPHRTLRRPVRQASFDQPGNPPRRQPPFLSRR